MGTQLYDLLDIIDEITNENGAPCKKTLQKIVYLVEEKNIELGFDYVIHYYGPYSSDLDFTVQKMVWDGLLNVTRTNNGHIISRNEKCGEEEQDYVKNRDMLNIVKNFAKDSPSTLELLATTLFVERNTIEKTKDKIMSGVIKIKGDKYNKTEIDDAILRLSQENYFCLS
jgi:uncharacterized protein YwgA